MKNIFKPVCLLFFVFATGGSFATAKEKSTTLFLIGDSTMATKSPEERPETGWGEKLADYLQPNVALSNHAVNGRSSKSFRDEGRWQTVVNSLKEGDYVFIQFGHNDQKVHDPERYTNPYTSYRDNLKRYILDIRTEGAIPVLISSIVRRNFNSEGTLVDTLAPYPAVMRELARDLDVTFIDLNTLSEKLVLETGVEGSKLIFMHLSPGEHANYPEGKIDNTHLKQEGAKAIARLVRDDFCISHQSLADELVICE